MRCQAFQGLLVLCAFAVGDAFTGAAVSFGRQQIASSRAPLSMAASPRPSGLDGTRSDVIQTASAAVAGVLASAILPAGALAAAKADPNRKGKFGIVRNMTRSIYDDMICGKFVWTSLFMLFPRTTNIQSQSPAVNRNASVWHNVENWCVSLYLTSMNERVQVLLLYEYVLVVRCSVSLSLRSYALALGK